MFSSYEFTFAGESSLSYGLMLYDFGTNGQNNVPFGNKADIIDTRTSRRIKPVHFGVNYHKNPLEFKLVFGAMEPLDRYDMERISMWLTGEQEYQWLSIAQPDLEHVQFRCLITSLTPLSHGWLPVAFEANVVCDCPYAYGFPFEKQYNISGETNILFRNDSSVKEYIRPVLQFDPANGTTELKIVNMSDNGRTFILSDIPSPCPAITVDCGTCVIRDASDTYNLYDGFNLNFLRFVHGCNNLVVTGDGVLTISGRFLHNTAG